MIELYEGRLGGGKTYSAVVRMVDHLRRGGVVCTNVELLWEPIKAYIAKRWQLLAEETQLIRLNEDHIGLFHRHTPSGTAALPVLVVIDEAHLVFNARDFAQTDKLYRETLTFLTQSRKVNTDVIFIAQSVLNMDKQFMRLVQFIWRFRDLAKWKIPGLGIPYPLKQLLAVQFDYDGKTILQRSFIRKDPAIFGLYNTNSLLRPFPRLESVATTRTLAKDTTGGKASMKIILPVLIICGIIAGVMLWKNVKSNMGAQPGGKSTPTAAPQAGSVDTTSKTASARQVEQEKSKLAYDLYSETFVAWNGPERALKTRESGWYQVGEMSTRGYVMAVSERRAKLAQPDGRQGWVLAHKEVKTTGAEVEVRPTPTPAPREIIVANDTSIEHRNVSTPAPTGTPFPISKAR